MNNTTIVSNNAMTVPFHGAELYVISHNDEPYTPLKPIVTGMNLTWHGQFLKLKSNANRWGILELRIPTKSGVQSMLCMPLRKLPAWLCSIEVGKIKSPGTREVVIAYQNECDDALWDYWNKGIAINPRPFKQARNDVLTVEEANLLRQTLEGDAEMLYPDNPEKRGTFIRQGWSKLKSHFGVSYKQIPRFELTAAVSILARHGTEWGMKHESPVTVTEVIKRGMDSIRAMVCVDLRSGDRSVRALKDSEWVVDLGDDKHVKSFIDGLDKSYYPVIAETIFQYYREVDRVYSGRRRANDMPVCAQTL